MSNGVVRTVLSKIQLEGKKGTAELNEEMMLEKKDSKMPKFPIKNPSEHNHSKQLDVLER